MLYNCFKLVKIERGFLINTVIEPVREKQICMGAPVEMGRLGWVVIWEIMLRNINWQTLVLIAEILVCESKAVVFKVPHKEKLPFGRVGDNVNARLG